MRKSPRQYLGVNNKYIQKVRYMNYGQELIADFRTAAHIVWNKDVNASIIGLILSVSYITHKSFVSVFLIEFQNCFFRTRFQN